MNFKFYYSLIDFPRETGTFSNAASPVRGVRLPRVLCSPSPEALATQHTLPLAMPPSGDAMAAIRTSAAPHEPLAAQQLKPNSEMIGVGP